MQTYIRQWQDTFDPTDMATLEQSYEDVVSAVGTRHEISAGTAERIAEIVIRCALGRPLLTPEGHIDGRAIVVETAAEVLKEIAPPS